MGKVALQQEVTSRQVQVRDALERQRAELKEESQTELEDVLKNHLRESIDLLRTIEEQRREIQQLDADIVTQRHHWDDKVKNHKADLKKLQETIQMQERRRSDDIQEHVADAIRNQKRK